MGKLTPKQAMFVQEYLVDLNGTQAAIRAGYSAHTAEAQASRLLSNVKVANAVQRAMAERSQRVEIDQDYVLKTIREVVESTKGGADYSAALKGCDLLGRHLNIWKDVGSKDNPLHMNVPLQVAFGKDDEE